jgi:phospholipid/cholesterol/gamma-HCH transport system substrate-binding protein
VRAEVKSAEERNPYVVGAVGLAVTAAALLLATNYTHLPFVNSGTEYSAYFADAGGLQNGAVVRTSGVDVGKVSDIELDGPRILVKFKVERDIRLGDRTEAAVKLANVLGTKLLEVTPRGEGELDAPIPLERTTPAYNLADALGDLSNVTAGLNTEQLSDSLSVLSNELSGTPPALRYAVQGLGRFSKTLADRDQQLRNLLKDANKVTTVLADRSDEILRLVRNANALLIELQAQSEAIDQISGNISAAAQQLKGFISENRQTLKPALDKLNGVLTILDNRKERIQKAIPMLNAFGAGLGESVSGAPGFKANVINLPPGQFIQPFIDAAFSDLGLDPATLPPTKINDPLVGQPATPPLPVPYPRTGQGGEPRTTIPGDITGNPGDRGDCPLPVAGCYPLKDEPPQPPPGGPPPGPPAVSPPGTEPTILPPGPVELPAPGQTPPTQSPALQGSDSVSAPPNPVPEGAAP